MNPVKLMKVFYFMFGILLSTVVSVTDCCSSRKIPKSRPPPSRVAVTTSTSSSYRPLSPPRLPAGLAPAPEHSNSFNEATTNNRTVSELAPPTVYVTTYKSTIQISTTANEANQSFTTQQPVLVTTAGPSQSIPTGHHRQDTTTPTAILELTTINHLKNNNNNQSQKEIDVVADKGDKNDQQQRRKQEKHYAHECPAFFAAEFCLHNGQCYYYNIGNGNGTFQLFYCVCSLDYFGERCESKSLDGTYHADMLQSSKRIRIETASICFGACLAFLLVILVLYTFYYYTQPSLHQRL